MHPAVIKFNNLPAKVAAPTWQQASDKARSTAMARQTIVKHLLSAGTAIDAAFVRFKQNLESGLVTPALSQAIITVNKVPSRATLFNWVKAYKANGLEGLLPAHRGRGKDLPNWATRALQFYHAPTSPSFAMVADDLKAEGYKVEAHQVRRFIGSLPHELGPKSPYRMGAKLYKEAHKDFKLRSTAHIPAGFLYNGDGHTLDVYLAHHKSGNPFRYELTALQDVRSRKIVAWDLSEAENTLATLNALTTSIKKYDHLVSMFYVDNGSGYKANMMNEECIGVYAQLDIEPIFAIPGNARAKWIERFFLHMEDRVGKRFQTYCGRHEDESFKKLVLKEIKQGKRHLPTVEEWVAEFNKFLDHYHNSPHPEETGKTRQQVWDENFVQSKPPHIDFDFLPKTKVKVRRGQIQLHKRTYTADYLHQFNGQELIAGFSMTDDKTIKLHELTGELLLIAHLKTKVPAIPESRIEQRRDERTKFQLKRLDKKKHEILAQAAKTRVVDVDEVEELAADTGPLSIEHKEQTPFFEMDLNDFLVEPEQPEALELTDFAVTEDDE